MSDINNLSAGIADPYWYEWSVGLLYALDMITDNNIQHVVLQANHLQGLDDVVIVYNDRRADCIQIKHTRENDSLTFSDLIYKTSKKPSLLNTFCKDWGNARNSYKTSKAILFSNRNIGVKKSFVKDENGVSHERPILEKFWSWLKEQLEIIKDLSEIKVPEEWATSWDLWLQEMDCLANDKLKLEFLRNFDIKTNQADFDAIIDAIGCKLSKIFKVDMRVVTQLDQKLCYALRTWTTNLRKKQEITKEDLFEALSLCSDEIQGEHNLKVCEPFFNSRLEFAQELEQKLANREAPIIFLSGDPGSGKTNVVSHIANKNNSVITLRFHAFKPMVAGDLHISADKGISDPRALWGNFLIILRELFTGKLSKHSVPVSNELLKTIDELTSEVLRLSKILADETGLTTVISIDGIDHAARAGGKNTFLNTLVPPERVPDGVCFLISGQPIHQYDLYPDWLADTDRVLHLNIPEINDSDIKQLICSLNVAIPIEDIDTAVKIISKTVAGNTLSAVFSVYEAFRCHTIDELELALNKTKLSSGIHSYYEYIWKSAKEHIPSKVFYVDTILAGTLSLVNKKVTPQIMTEICGDDNINDMAWQRVMQKLYPIVIKENGQFRVFHNDVRIYLEYYLRKDTEIYNDVSSRLADYFLNKSDDKKSKHELVYRLLEQAKRKHEYIDIFTQKYVIEAIQIKRPMGEITEQLDLTLQCSVELDDFKKMLSFSCAVATLYQYRQSLQWSDQVHEAEYELPVALQSEKKVLNKAFFTDEILLGMLGDVKTLIDCNEYERAKNVISRWFENLSPEEIVEILKTNKSGDANEENDLNDEIKLILKTWGMCSQYVNIDFDFVVEEDTEIENRKIARAFFAKGWLEEGENFLEPERINNTLGALEYYFTEDFERYFNILVNNDKFDQIEELMSLGECDKFSNTTKIQFVIRCILNQKLELCKKWKDEILNNKFKYVNKKQYDVQNNAFPIYIQIALILSYFGRKISDFKKECLEEFKGDKFTPVKRGYYSANNLLVSSSFFGFLCKSVFDGKTESISLIDFEAFINQLFDRKEPIGNYEVGGLQIEQFLLRETIEIVKRLDVSYQNLLKNVIIYNVKDYETIRHLDICWNYLRNNNQEAILLELFDYWMNETGLLWQQELSEIIDIGENFISKAEDIGWSEKAKNARKLLESKLVGYVGRKEYSLFSPLKWYEELDVEHVNYWETLGLQMLNISQYASDTGDNRASVYINAAVSVSAGKQGPKALWEFANTKETWDTNWLQTIFDGVIACLEKDNFTESELLSIWRISSEVFFVQQKTMPYDSANELRKIYIADIKEAILFAGKRLGFNKIEDKMQQIAATEFIQNRKPDVHSNYRIPERWFEGEEIRQEILGFMNEIENYTCSEVFNLLKWKFFNDRANFRWDFIVEFIKKIKRTSSESVVDYTVAIIGMLMQRNDAYSWEWDGANRLFDILFPYLNEDQIRIVFNDIVQKYLEKNIYSDESKLFGLNNDLDSFTFCYYSRLSENEKKQGLEILLSMHSNWMTGYGSIVIPTCYKNSLKANAPFSWENFCMELRNKLLNISIM